VAVDTEFRLTFRDAFRTLLLPIDPAREDDALEAAIMALDAQGIAREDQPAHIRASYAAWHAGQPRTAGLSGAISAALRAGNGDLGGRFASNYFPFHEETLQRRHLYSFEQATSFLSHLRLAVQLAAHESMSAAQIAKILGARDHRVGFGWRAVRDVLRALGYRFELTEDAVEGLFQRDLELEEIAFADADFYDAAGIVGIAGSELGFPGDLQALLLRLFSPEPDGLRHGPYLQILHYVVTVAEFYDHALKVLYEFAPRGQVAVSIFNSYPIDLRASGNPVLNNAKSIDVLDSGWARSKEDYLPASTAVFEIIDGLEQLGFAARKDLSAWIRRWLHRVVRLTRIVARRVPDSPTEAEIEKVVTAVAEGPTRTFGVIEQRLTDVLALCAHPFTEGWRNHGIGDSVNASNVSRRKIGDAEFQHATARTVVAYESHAGRLTDVYVDGHIEALRRVIPLRSEEWERVAPRGEWSLDVRFLAHDVTADRRELEIDGFRVQIVPFTFADFCSHQPDGATLLPIYHAHMTLRLNEARTPQTVRDRYIELTS
jgi:hypothetical protein